MIPKPAAYLIMLVYRIYCGGNPGSGRGAILLKAYEIGSRK